jgi:drug/metabolite transporter (DMT)-like permease
LVFGAVPLRKVSPWLLMLLRIPRNPVSKVMPVMLLLPVFTITSSMLFIGEQQPTLMIFIGGTVVIGGVSLIVLTKDPKLVS